MLGAIAARQARVLEVLKRFEKLEQFESNRKEMFENLLKRSEYHLIYLSTVYILSACLRPALSFPGRPQMKMKSLIAAAPGHHRGRMVGCSSTQPLSTGSYTSSDWKVIINGGL